MKKFLACLTLMLLVATTASAQVQRTVMEQGFDGFNATVQHSDRPVEAPPTTVLGDEYLVGQRSVDYVIYNTCGIGPDGHYASTEHGSDLNPALIENLNLDCSVNWSFETNRAEYALGHRGAVIVENAAIDGGTVMGAGNGEYWGWTFDMPNCTPKCIAQTPDGSVVVVGVNKSAGGVLTCFNGFTGEILSTYEMPAGGWARGLDITPDGTLVASRGNLLHVIETATGNALHNASAGASCDVVAISADGHWLVAGWSSMQVYERVGDSYTLRWTHRRVPSSYATFAKVNSNGDIVCGLNTGSWNRTYVHMVNASDSSHDGVLYEGPLGDGSVQEGVRSIFFGDDSNLAVLGNWGDAYGETPEVMVFEFGNIRPVATLDTRGSIYCVDGFVTADGSLEIVACGKQTHANVFGNGGDYYTMFIPGIVSNEDEDETPDIAVFQTSLAGAYPNPFNPMTRVQFTLDRSQHVTLTVFDLAGKRIAELADGVFERGEQSVLWNGKDMTGRNMPSGNYVVSMETEEQMRTSKMTLVR